MNIGSDDPSSVPPFFRYMPKGLRGSSAFHKEAHSAFRRSILFETHCATVDVYKTKYKSPVLYTTLKISPKHGGMKNINLRAISDFQKNGAWYDNVSVALLEDGVGEVQYAAELVWFVDVKPLPDNENDGDYILLHRCYINLHILSLYRAKDVSIRQIQS